MLTLEGIFVEQINHVFSVDQLKIDIIEDGLATHTLMSGNNILEKHVKKLVMQWPARLFRRHHHKFVFSWIKLATSQISTLAHSCRLNEVLWFAEVYVQGWRFILRVLVQNFRLKASGTLFTHQEMSEKVEFRRFDWGALASRLCDLGWARLHLNLLKILYFTTKMDA